MKFAGRISFEQRDLWIDAEPHVMQKIRNLFPRGQNMYVSGQYTHKQLRVPLTRDSARDLVWICERFPLEFEDGLEAKVRALSDDYEAIRSAVSTADADPEWKVTEGALTPSIPLFEHQIKFVNMARKMKKMLLADALGTGKAQPVTEPVLTPTGWIPIGNIKTGDYVIGRNGNKTRVVGVYPQGLKPIYKVTLTDRTFTFCCGEHLWSYATPDSRNRHPGKLFTSNILDIKEKQDKTPKLHKFFLPPNEVVNFEKKETEIDPYLLGVLLGDGCISCGFVMFSSADQEIIDSVSARIPPNTVVRYTGHMYDYAIRKTEVYRHPLIASLNALGLMGTKSHTKFVPDPYLFTDYESRLLLLQGLMDTDGCAERTGVSFATSSVDLASAVEFLVHSFGGVTTRSIKHIKGYRDSYRLWINVPCGFPIFRLKRKADKMRTVAKYVPTRAIDTVESAGESECVCIKVESEDGLYLTRDFIVTHNTFSNLGVLAYPDARPALIVCPTHLCIQWQKESQRLYPGTTSQILYGYTPSEITPVDFAITSYNRVPKWIESLMKFNPQAVVLDEVHELRKTDTEKRRATVMLTAKSTYSLGASGTPIFNYGEEIFSVLDAINPGCLGEEPEWRQEWCNWGKVTEPAILGNYLKTQGLMLRRTTDDLGFLFGKTSRHVITLDADLKSLEAIKDVAKQLALSIFTGSLDKASEAERELDWKLRMATGVAKARSVAEFVKMVCAQGEKVLLSAWHRNVHDILLKELKDLNPVMYTGTESPKQKDAAKQKFVEDDSCQVFILSARSGAGLDGLQHVCRTVVHGELDWSPHVHDQINMRCDRLGQTKHVQAYYLTIPDGSDPFIMSILNVKRSQADGIVDEKVDVDILDLQQNSGRIREMAAAYLKSINEEVPIPVEETGLLKEVADVLRHVRVPSTMESQLQEALWAHLPGTLSAVVEREVKVGKRSRLDFLVSRDGERIAIECKRDAMDRQSVYKQVRRYAEEANVSAVVLFAPWFGIASFKVDGIPVVIVDYSKAGV